ncbi:MAG TPA: 4Fe-4S ferredoxin [Myxococcales bacterium]|nr:4Fe-4S ferredoxin [Deltaproteobacteria bacterium]MBU49873.1 4Fe-4S ferredoxin [Deltaproteobacteria bacterium]HAA59260.1 4Fe-4S ferredoxin [Myxococcales bacterium]|tara:strand:- start:15171 stop:16307 length:1137 start_codon:yes stop_codon:yes gene_type:complete
MRRAGAAGWFVHDVKNRGITAWLITIFLLGFYILLYFGGKIFKPENDPFILTAKAMGLPSKWTLYGLIYTIAILVCGIYVIIKYKHNRYQIVRTCVVIFSQVVLAFSIPLMLKFFEQPEYYFSYIWPLKIEYFYPSTIVSQPLPFVLYSIFAGVVLAPFMALIFGKRWYCSWVCGCGGLANTFGEPWRHLSDKSSTSWKIEKFTIHAVLVLSVLVTIVAFASVALPKSSGMVPVSKEIRSWYGLIIGSVLSGVVGVGLYPIGGTRIWCRFACPMAALLGLVQKFGRFRIRVKKDMCISCGMCTTYCEMGIDVRAYAQANESFTRASCVGCGICAEVCPRGVLRLENVHPKDPQELSLIDVEESWKGEDFSIQSRKKLN